MTKRLLISAGKDYDGPFEVVPVNTHREIIVETDIGDFGVQVDIRDFDGSKKHLNNSKHNVGDVLYLNGNSEPTEGCPSKDLVANEGGGSPVSEHASSQEKRDASMSNLSIRIRYTPKVQVRGSELLFGNDIMVPIREYVPAALLSTALKFFTWFINPSVKGDVYNDKPFLYGLSLNSFNFMSLFTRSSQGESKGVPEDPWTNDVLHSSENLNENEDNALNIPVQTTKRQRFFNNIKNCESFVFNTSTTYFLQFDSNFLKFMDSKYSVAIPTYGKKTFDIDALKYANENLSSFNWIIKIGGYEGVGYGRLGLVLNFALEDENFSSRYT